MASSQDSLESIRAKKFLRRSKKRSDKPSSTKRSRYYIEYPETVLDLTRSVSGREVRCSRSFARRKSPKKVIWPRIVIPNRPIQKDEELPVGDQKIAINQCLSEDNFVSKSLECVPQETDIMDSGSDDKVSLIKECSTEDCVVEEVCEKTTEACSAESVVPSPEPRTRGWLRQVWDAFLSVTLRI